MISTKMYRELLNRENLSSILLRQKITVLESQIEAIEAHQCNTFGEGTDGWKEMDAILEDRNSEMRKAVRQIAISQYGHLGIVQIAARWDASSDIERARMLKDLPPYSDLLVNIMSAYIKFEGKKWDSLDTDIVAEFEKFALDGKKSTEVVI